MDTPGHMDANNVVSVSHGNVAAVRKRNASAMLVDTNGIGAARYNGDTAAFLTSGDRGGPNSSSNQSNEVELGWSKSLSLSLPLPFFFANNHRNNVRASLLVVIILITTVTTVITSHVRQAMQLWDDEGILPSRTSSGRRSQAIATSSSSTWANSRSDIVPGSRSSSSSLALHTHTRSSSSTSSLDVHKRPIDDASIMLIHVGKAGGSAMREIVTRTRALCNNLKSNGYYTIASNENNDHDGSSNSSSSDKAGGDPTNDTGLMRHVCAFAKVTNWNQCFHLNRHHRDLRSYNHFLIPVRNPVDRIVSYIMNVDRTRYGERLDVLSRCYDTVDDLLVQGLDPTTTKAEVLQPSSSSAAKLPNTTHDVCRKVAKDCVTGRYPCYAHNFFKYEYYLESLLKRLDGMVESESKNATTLISSSPRTNDEGDKLGKGSENNDQDSSNHRTKDQQIRIDVVRAEHSAVDMNRTLELWTGKPTTVDFAMLYIHRKPHDIDPALGGNSYNKYVSPLGATRLCQTICSELVVYRTILKYASNLSPTDIRQSYQELDDKCGFHVDKVCGTEYTFRGIRKKRKERICDPIQTPPQPPLPMLDVQDWNSSGYQPRRRLFLDGDHPPC